MRGLCLFNQQALRLPVPPTPAAPLRSEMRAHSIIIIIIIIEGTG